MLHLGLCCLLHEADKSYKFRIYTRKKISSLSLADARSNVHEVVYHNIATLQKMLDYCYMHNITSYRLSSDLIPHFDYVTNNGIITPAELQDMLSGFSAINTNGIQLSLHPGQHVSMASDNPDIISRSCADLRYHMLIADAVGFNEINIHLGGAYGDPASAMERFIHNFKTNIPEVLPYLTLENDELSYNVHDCVYVAKALGCRVTYDLHHQRCNAIKNPVKTTEHEMFLLAKQTWLDAGHNYMRMHISTPKNGYTTPSKSRPHADLIDSADIPQWLLKESKSFAIHIDVEAKHKQTALKALHENLLKRI